MGLCRETDELFTGQGHFFENAVRISLNNFTADNSHGIHAGSRKSQ